MKANDKTGLLTMCRKAGRLSMGMDMTKDACKNGNAFGVFITTDISEKSRKEVRYVCGRYGVKLYSLGTTMDELHGYLGRRTGIMAMTDKGFAQACAKGLEEILPDADSDY